MSKYKEFLIQATERAVKSAGQFGLVAWGATVFTEIGDVVGTAQAVALAMGFGLGLSYLTSLASMPFGDKGTPSIVKEEPVDE